MIKSGNEQGPLAERIAAASGLDHVPCQDLEIKAELLPQLVLPLLHQAARRDHEASLDVTPDHELLAEQPSHDRLAGTRVIG